MVEYLPVSQLEQDVEEFEPSMMENFATSQSMHFDKPPTSENDPAAHGEQVESEKAPSSAEYLPAAQAEQAEAPSSAEYLPAAHGVHEDAYVVPSLTPTENCPAWQSVHPFSVPPQASVL